MNWATRPVVHVDRAACAWLILKFIDPDATFAFVEDLDDVPPGTRPFDMPGADLSHHGTHCTFETMLGRFGLADAALHDIGRIIHEADLGDERYDAPEACGLDVVIRGMSLLLPDNEIVQRCLPIFEGLYEDRRQANVLGTIPS
jgi:hypothetical protein